MAKPNKRHPPAGEPEAAFEIKGTVSSLTVLRLRTGELERIETELAKRIAPFPQIFACAPVVVDVAELEARSELAWESLVRILRAVRLTPVGVTGAGPADVERAVAAGLGVLQLGSRLRAVEPESEPASEAEAIAVAPEPASVESAATPPEPAVPTSAEASSPATAASAPVREPMSLLQPVRGGQVVYAKAGDLVVVSSVNPGAQVIADGSVQIWGPLRGRALAGAQGKKNARIFCLALEAELVSIAGEYLMAEEIPDALRGKPAQIFLDSGQVKISAL